MGLRNGNATNIIGRHRSEPVLRGFLKLMYRYFRNTTIHACKGIDRQPNFSAPPSAAVELILTWFEALGYIALLESDIVSGRHQQILRTYQGGILGDRFRTAMARINAGVSQEAIEGVLEELATSKRGPILQENRRWHFRLLDGIETKSGTTLRLLDYAAPANNDWLVIHGFPVIEDEYQHCLDLAVFVNGLPLAVFGGLFLEDREWSLRTAYLQLQECKTHLPRFFSFNELMVVSNGVRFRVGTLTDEWQQLISIRSANGEKIPCKTGSEIATFIQEVFDKRRFLEIVRHFIVFHPCRKKLRKKLRPYSFCTLQSPVSRG